MHPLDRIPKLPTQVPPEEFDAFTNTLDACILLHQLEQQFQAAIELFDFCEDRIEAEKTGAAAVGVPLLKQWRSMAGRDAGITLFNFAMTLETIAPLLKNMHGSAAT